MVLNVLDVLTTIYGLSLGGTEINPVARYFISFNMILGLGILKLIGLVVMIGLINTAIKINFIKFNAYIIPILMFTVVIINNIYQIISMSYD